jgi:hypothetical protein
MTITELKTYVKECIIKAPSKREKLIELLLLAVSEIEEGGSESHECDLAYRDIEEIMSEVENIPVVSVGDRVTYSDGYKTEQGIVKEVKSDGMKAFIVYKCGGQWDHYKEYTGVLTDLSMVKLGWDE